MFIVSNPDRRGPVGCRNASLRDAQQRLPHALTCNVMVFGPLRKQAICHNTGICRQSGPLRRHAGLKPARRFAQTSHMTRTLIRRFARTCLFIPALAGLAASCLLPLQSAQAVEVSAAYRSTAERGFKSFLEGLWPEAKQRGVSRKTFDRAVSRMQIEWDIPDLDPPPMGGEDPKPSPKRQAEFGSPGRYFSEKSMNNLAAIGRKEMARFGDTLQRIEQRTGVDKEILAAIWGRETAYSRASIPHDAMSVLATQAYLGRRPDFFRPEVLAILEIAERGVVPVNQLKSSWAGAMGHTQMLPGLYLKHATDGDGDGKVDIWNSVPDALATSASFLKASGWVPGLSWAYEVEPSSSLDCTLEGPDAGRPVADWVAAGATRVAGRQWPQSLMGAQSYLIMPAGRFGPAFRPLRAFRGQPGGQDCRVRGIHHAVARGGHIHPARNAEGSAQARGHGV
jgi:lytic murein transglycosylase